MIWCSIFLQTFKWNFRITLVVIRRFLGNAGIGRCQVGRTSFRDGKIQNRGFHNYLSSYVLLKVNTKCSSKSGNLCCKQVVHTQSFKSSVTQKTYHIFNDLNCKSKLLIYLMECRICPIQYIGKSETEFNIRLNNHRKDADRKIRSALQTA